LESRLAKKRDSEGTIVESYLDSADPVPEKRLELLKSVTHTFAGVGTSIRDMFKHLGAIEGLEKPILIAHNGSRFDDYLLLGERVDEMLKDEGFEPYKILKTPQGILSMQVTNKYTSPANQALFKQKFLAKNKRIKTLTGGEFYQKITFRCSLQHIKASLKTLCESYKLPKNLRKTEVAHDSITLDNYAEKRPE